MQSGQPEEYASGAGNTSLRPHRLSSGEFFAETPSAPTQSEINSLLAGLPSESAEASVDVMEEVVEEDEADEADAEDTTVETEDAKKVLEVKETKTVLPQIDEEAIEEDKGDAKEDSRIESSATPEKIQAYALLDFENFTFYVQTMQILLGRMVEGDRSTESLDVHLGLQKAISRRHAKIFYNFGHQRFEMTVMGRNGAFVDDSFVETGATIPLHNDARIQIGETRFKFVLPSEELLPEEDASLPEQLPTMAVPISPSQAVDLKSALGKTEEVSSATTATGSPNPEARPPVLSKADLLRTTSPHEAQAKAIAQNEAFAIQRGYLPAKNVDYANKLAGYAPIMPAGPDQPPKPKQGTARRRSKSKKVYLPEEIPPQYREKPSCSYLTMIVECIKKKGTSQGMSLPEIYEGIQEFYPYFKYCPDGWQNSVRHNLSMNKVFKKVSKEGKNWLWGLDLDALAEKEKPKKETHNHQKDPSPSSKLSNDTKKALGYLQKELVRLTKDRKMYDKATTTEILTQALAMTIAQVNQAAKHAGIKGSPLLTLIDKNPAHVTKILSAALNAATIQIARKKGLKVELPKPAAAEVVPKPHYYGKVAPAAYKAPKKTAAAVVAKPAPIPAKPALPPAQTASDSSDDDDDFTQMVENLEEERQKETHKRDADEGSGLPPHKLPRKV